MVDTVEQILLKDPHIACIIPGESWPQLPFNHGVFRCDVDKKVGPLYVFLHAPYIVDTFETHRERRDWRLSLDAQVFDYVSQNALRGSSWIRNKAHALVEGYVGVDPKAVEAAGDRLLKLAKQDDSKRITVPERRQLKHDVYAFLQVLSEKSMVS